MFRVFNQTHLLSLNTFTGSPTQDESIDSKFSTLMLRLQSSNDGAEAHQETSTSHPGLSSWDGTRETAGRARRSSGDRAVRRGRGDGESRGGHRRGAHNRSGGRNGDGAGAAGPGRDGGRPRAGLGGRHPVRLGCPGGRSRAPVALGCPGAALRRPGARSRLPRSRVRAPAAGGTGAPAWHVRGRVGRSAAVVGAAWDGRDGGSGSAAAVEEGADLAGAWDVPGDGGASGG